MKNTLLTLLGFTVLCTPLAATAAQFGDFTYASDGSAILIYGYTGPGGAVTIPATISGLPVRTIGWRAFEGKTNLTSVAIPDSVTFIGGRAFFGNTSLASVTIPGSVTNIESQAFQDCTSLLAITVDAANAFYSNADGVLFDKNQTTLLQYPGGKVGSYSIPGSVTQIGYESFAYCTGLINVTIPDSVTTIGDGVFVYCTSLTSVTILGGVNLIQVGMFANCTKLTSIEIPDSVIGIEDGAFAVCTSLTNITMPGSVIGFGCEAFQDCTNLTGVFFKGQAPNAPCPPFFGDPNATVYYLPGTTGWGATFAGRPTRLWNPLMQSSGPSFGIGPEGFGFNITGTTNIPIVVEACTNLANANWVPLQSLNLTNGAFYFNDPNWTNYAARNYRIRSP